MRVISGSARGRKLKKVPGETTRPIMDRVKESLFNILGQEVLATRWLDLFAGTGQVGIEALSRGAAEVVFTDNARQAIRTIHENLKITQLSSQAKVLSVDAFAYLRGFGDRPFDIIYVAPPQYKEMWVQVMEILTERPSHFLTADGIIIVQIDPKEYRPLTLPNLTLADQRRYGNTQLDFYEQSALSE
jgi:16S rRNA (guanine(966)-N(2))-methyltransferase RsmD